MKRLLPAVLAFLASQTLAQQVPSIVKTVPEFWQVGVRPSLRELSLTFNQPMRYGFSSWLGSSGIIPASQLQSSSSPDGLIGMLSVSLQPGKVYVFALNETQKPGVGFQNKKGVPLPRTFLVFQTAGTLSPDDTPPRALFTSPAHGAQGVDSARTKVVTISFDKPMQTAKHGLHMRENQKDVALSKAKFQYSPDGKSFTLGYDFKPEATYEFELNSVHDIGFASARRIPLWPVHFAFSTQ